MIRCDYDREESLICDIIIKGIFRIWFENAYKKIVKILGFLHFHKLLMSALFLTRVEGISLI